MAQRVESKRRALRDTGGLPGWVWGLIGALVGLGIGLFVAWQLFPVTYSNYSPNDLSPGGRQIWVEMVADSFALEGDPSQAQYRLQFFSVDELRQIIATEKQEAQGNLAKLERLEALEEQLGTTITGNGQTGAAPESSDDGGLNLGTLAIGLGVTVLAVVLLLGGAVLFTRMQQAQAAPRREGGAASVSRRGSSTRTPATLGPPPTTGRQEVDTPDQPLSSLEGESEDYPFPAAVTTDSGNDDDLFDQLFEDTEDDVEEAAGVAVADAPRRDFEFAEPPVAAPTYSAALDQFLARYNYGDDGYDMSFSIETPQTEFLGECGVGICEVLGAGSPQKVTAFEVWLFDKDDIRTVTKVLLSDHAAASEELRGKLAPKGEMVPIKSGDTIDLETKSLRVRARIRELEYGKEGTPRSYFERFVVELTPQQKV